MSGVGGPLASAVARRGALTVAEAGYGLIVHAVEGARDVAGHGPMGAMERAQLNDCLRRIGVGVPEAEAQ